ncbi:MAG: sodium-translocating pyrophosphatase [Candidatus Omnitrophica bacterium CG11_big_fil_rev_8_21_14_0_20_63_9]|nr:MAG: sodium-translocating pyrophosphatase [Candidatus Omnitrophica bacterium CG11_big_fil_rev_8_21_14_0_20_63_9]
MDSLFTVMADPEFSNWERAALWSVLGTAVLGLLYAVFLAAQMLRKDQGTEAMRKISEAIRIGANAYLVQQFKTMLLLIFVLTGLLYFTAGEQHIKIGRAAAFILGAGFSWLVGFVGMNLAVQGNVRVAAASRTSFAEALKIAYRTGTITGMLTDGLGLLGGTLIFMIYGEQAYEVLLGFGFGGTLLALFMRVGGGIYTKAADVGADLVGKLEKDIPEDDPRNAATIADNVGDNVGDCAGMAADIFESYEVTIVAAMILGWASFGHKGVIFPLLVRAIGVVSSIIGTYLVRTSEEARAAMKAIHMGYATSAVVSIVGFVVVGFYYLRFPAGEMLPGWISLGVDGLDMRPVWTTLVGIALAISINYLTDYFTAPEKNPVQFVARATQTGHATTIINGFAVGLESSVWSILVIALAIFGSFLIYQGTNPTYIAYGVAMCGIGMLTLTGNNISMDVFGPVADNANGIGEMAHLDKKARQTLADLDAVGNTTKAITKGIAIGSAVIAAVSLFNAYITDIARFTGQTYEAIVPLLSISEPMVFIGFLIGGSIPFLFSSMTIRAVGRAAFLIVQEVREQFKDKAIWEGTKKPDYARVVGICTSEAQRELIGPGLLAVLAPVIVGMLLHKEALGGFLAGIILSGQLLAVFMSNAGGAWDNAKKFIEDGHYGGKGSDAHKASITGDTVGDPLKDTAGPALNPLIKVMNMVSLLILPFVVAHQEGNLFVWLVVLASIAILAVVIYRSKQESPAVLKWQAAIDKASTV